MAKAYWEFNNSADPWSSSTAVTRWIRYPDLLNLRIEQAYQKKEQKVSIGSYYIELSPDAMVQVSKEDKSRQRPVRRVEEGTFDSDHTRVNRFSYPDKPIAKNLGDPGVWMSPFVESWIKRNPNYKYNEEQTLEQIASGLEHEAEEIRENEGAAVIGSLVRDYKGRSRDEIIQFCVTLYTADSWIFKSVNKALREDDPSKVDTLGPFCCYVRSYLYALQKRSRGEMTVYRGMRLDQNDIDLYKESVGQVKSWLAFASTSLDPNKAEEFLSECPAGKVPTLFIIRYESDSSQYFPGKDISDLSMYGHEKEVLLHPGADFRVEKVEENVGVDRRTVIQLALM